MHTAVYTCGRGIDIPSRIRMYLSIYTYLKKKEPFLLLMQVTDWNGRNLNDISD